jgi:hypothetical protein
MRPPEPWPWDVSAEPPKVGAGLVFDGRGWRVKRIAPPDPFDEHQQWIQSLRDKYGPKPETPESLTYRTVVEKVEPKPGFWPRLWQWLRGDP